MTEPKIEFPGGSADEATRTRVASGMANALASLRVKPTTTRVTFTDDNGPKGGNAIRCALEVRLPRRPAVHVEHTASTSRLAFDGALAKLERRLARLRGIARESKRRPKKYFAARRAQAGA